MEALLTRYRNLTILLIAVVAQLLLLAYQVKTNQDVRLIRVWAVTTVTPLAGTVEAVRRNTIGFLEDYFILLDVREQNRKLRAENGRLKMENQYYRTELSTADRARALSVFQLHTPSKTVAARITGNGTVSTSKVVFIDRGSTSGVAKGMAVVTPDGIVGKVIAVYPLASQVLLITDPTFAAGVESQKNRVHGTLKGGSSKCTVENVQNEEKVDVGEWFYTSGEDRIFPKGFPVGQAVAVRTGTAMKEIYVNPRGLQGGTEEVLVVLEGVHQQIPEKLVASTEPRLLPLPPPDGSESKPQTKIQTEADKIKQQYEEIGKAQNHTYGAYPSKAPDFNIETKQKEAAQQNSVKENAAQDTVQPPSDKPAAPKPPAANNQPLGARPPATRPSQGTPSPQETKPATPNPGTGKTPTSVPKKPVLPLGAPRPKPEKPPAPEAAQQP